jgi:hypothetical protein
MRAPTLRVLLLALLAAAAAGCHYGPRIETFEPARSPEGIHVKLDLQAGATVSEISGELLAVREDGLLLNVPTDRGATFRSPRRVTLVAYRYVRKVDARPLSDQSPATSVADRETLRRLSRFPQGLSTELLDALMVTQDQTALAVVGGSE